MDKQKKYHVGYEVHTLDRLMFKNMELARKRAGLEDLEGINGWILGYLYRESKNDIYQKHLEAEFSIGRSTVTNIMKTLEASGYILRQDVPEDARLKKLVLTEAGIQKHLDTISMFNRIEEAMTAGISDEDMETFSKVMEQIKKNTEKMMGETTC